MQQHQVYCVEDRETDNRRSGIGFGMLVMAERIQNAGLDAAPDPGSIIPVDWLPETFWPPAIRQPKTGIYRNDIRLHLWQRPVPAMEPCAPHERE